MTVGRPAAFLLLAVALIAALGHVCVRPVAVHAAGHDRHDPTAPADGGGESHHHSSPDAGPVHVESCDAVGTPVAAPPAMPSTWAAVRADVPMVRERPGALVAAKVHLGGPSPPLFLLHAALLI